MPLAVSQSGSNPTTNDPEQKSKFEQNGKKFGKKLGNAGMSRVYCLILTKRSNYDCSNLRCRCYCRLQHREQYLLNSIHISLILCGLEIPCLAAYSFSLLSLEWRWWNLFFSGWICLWLKMKLLLQLIVCDKYREVREISPHFAANIPWFSKRNFDEHIDSHCSSIIKDSIIENGAA